MSNRADNLSVTVCIGGKNAMKTFLHVGCGSREKAHTTPAFASEDWQEVRLDIDASVHPDIVGTMTDMSALSSESVDAIFSSHNIEHLYPHEVPLALAEFLRVLRPQGIAVITCPDLQSVAALVADDRLLDQAYQSPSGPITPLDILYGFRPAMASGNAFMAHHCGFTKKVLDGTLLSCGFKSVGSLRRAPPFFDLWAIASKNMIAGPEMMELAGAHLPR
jgi:predicted SAM-dependent methyltransferase